MEMTDLLAMDRRAKAIGAARHQRRDLYAVLEAEHGRHIRGVAGPRGAGKTILLQQLAAEYGGDGFYLAADTLDKATDLYELVRELSEAYQCRFFLIDEIHYLDDAIGALKRIYDFLEVTVVFTSSVALRIHEAAHDLARRVRLHRLEYFSFREYLAFRHGERLPGFTLESFLEGAVEPGHLRAADRFDAYLEGGLVPFALEEPQPFPLLENTIETIIAKDIPRFLRLHVDELELLRRMIAFIGRSGVDGINYSSLSANLGITKYKAAQYVSAFERAFILQCLFPAGTNVLKEPKILLMPPLRALYHPTVSEGRGGLREDFFVFAMRQAGYALNYLKGTRGQKTPDFLLEHGGRRIVFEIGGKGKGRSQFKGVRADRKVVLAEQAGLTAERMPLHLAGFLLPPGLPGT
ncbi:MAG: ATP-binding protein [Opitutales bacterium]